MQHYDLGEILARREQAGRAYLEFLRVPTLSVGVYCLKAGALDPQQPHTEDEVYFVLGGRGNFCAGAGVKSVEAGAVLFVEKGAEHGFCDITEDLTVLVFFAPAEGSGSHRG
jgi:quercetin dioxygenase-like cupin family protein